MEWRRVLTGVILLVTCFFAGFVARSPDEDTDTKNGYSANEPSIGYATDGKYDIASNPQKANGHSPHWYTAFKRPELLSNPSWWQVYMAFVGIAVLAYQAMLNRRATNAMRASVKLQKVAMDQWVDTEEWFANSSGYIPPGSTEAVLSIGFHITNPTKFKMIFRRVDLWLDRQIIKRIYYGEMFLAPDEYAIIEIDHSLKEAKLKTYLDSILRFEFGGEIYFVDAFGEKRSQKFGRLCSTRYRGESEFEPIAFRPPDEEELGNQGKAQGEEK